MSALTWGRHYLMCPPTHFEVAYAINPWMGGTVDAELAMAQWETLVATIRLAGGQVDLVAPVPGLPDMVFTANAAVVDAGGPEGPVFIAARMRHAERVAETAHFTRWAAAHGMAVERLDGDAVLEGLGDCMPLGEALVVGHGARSSHAAHGQLHALTGRDVVSVELGDPRWYHVDLTLCPLDDRRAITFPDAYDAAGARQVMDRIPDPLVLTPDEAATFAANSVVVGTTVIMPACPPRVGRWLQARGFDVAVVDVSEFVKAGGAVRCLTLPLDTVLATPDDRALVANLEVA